MEGNEEEENWVWRMQNRDWEHKETPFFSTLEDLEKKQGQFRKRRYNYLQSLVTEFQDTEKPGKYEYLVKINNIQ